MSAPPVPPRPYSAYDDRSSASAPPPVPPLPPDLRLTSYESPPHFDRPLVAPQPHRLDLSIPANMARTLDDQLHQPFPTGRRRPSPAPPPTVNYSPGFAIPVPGPTSLPPPIGATWSSWAPPTDPYAAEPRPPTNPPFAPAPHPVPHGPPPSSPAPHRSPPSVPSLTAPIPTIASLQSHAQSILQPAHDPALKISWSRDVLFLVDKQQNSTSTDTQIGPAVIANPQLLRLSQIAVQTVLQISASNQTPVPPHVAEAVYLRATIAASGAYPDYVKHNPRSAFRDFESAARGGYASAWFRLGRDYETFNDVTHARDCFERGVKLGVESCAYRMGMAHLMGQLGLPANPALAIPLLHRAATLATIDVPQPAYVYALLLLAEFSQISTPLPPSVFAPYIPQSSSHTLEARKHLERAAYLNFAPAQYKLGHAYEFAQPPFPFDALLSVQYYSLASQQGEVEADMALSKWFLCGSGDGDGGFDKDEALAWTFADKAARRGLPSAEFAMGYYAEVGVGGPKNLQAATQWYAKAKDHGNADAAERLDALSQPLPQALSRHEHDTITESKLVRKRTQARQRSDRQPQQNQPIPTFSNTPSSQHPSTTFPPPTSAHDTMPYQKPQQQPPPVDGNQVVDFIRKTSLAGYPGSGPVSQHYQQAGRLPPMAEHQYTQPTSAHPSASPHPRPQSGPPGRMPYQQFPNSNRYTLTDSPVTGSSRTSSGPVGRGTRRGGGHGRSHSASGGSTGDTAGPAQDVGVPEAEAVSKPGKGPTTFAEMGFQGAKAEDKECVVM